MYNYETELIHHGVKGMKWGVRKVPERLNHLPGDSSVTKRVKNEYNSLNDQQFKSKYRVSKKVYAKRVKKYGDPYMNSPLAKFGKKMSARNKKLGRKDNYVNDKHYKRYLGASALAGLAGVNTVRLMGNASKSSLNATRIQNDFNKMFFDIPNY